MEILLSKGETYVPEYVEWASPERHEVVPFRPGIVEELYSDWKGAGEPSVWGLHRHDPAEVEITLAKGSVNPFQAPGLQVESSYFTSPQKLDEFLSLAGELYLALHAAYGFVELLGMSRRYKPDGKEWSPGIDLKRGLPGIYWANFFGPEYVEMFGVNKVQSAPCHGIENLPDGGVLLVLSPSPFDFERDRETFEMRRLELKRHLGLEAFDPSDWNPTENPGWRPQGKTPNFRFLETRDEAGRSVEPKASSFSDLLSTIPREQWGKWLENSHTQAMGLVRDMGAKGLGLDFSGESLRRLDAYLSKVTSDLPRSVDFLMKLAAYVSEVVIRRTGAEWSFEESLDIPELKLGYIRVSPLARAQKVLLEGETFTPWYRHLLDDLASKTSPPRLDRVH